MAISRDDIFRYIVSIVRDEFIADDICQETLVDVFLCKTPTPNVMTKEYDYFVLRVARNRCMNFFRKRKRSKEISTCDFFNCNAISDDSAIEEQINNDEKLINIIYKLPVKNRDVVLMKLMGLKHKEISKIMGICVDAVLDRNNRAKVLFKKIVA